MKTPKENLKEQIRLSISTYDEVDPICAMLSGMSLVAEYLAKQDGSTLFTPQLVAAAIHEVAKERGFVVGKLNEQHEPPK